MLEDVLVATAELAKALAPLEYCCCGPAGVEVLRYREVPGLKFHNIFGL